MLGAAVALFLLVAGGWAAVAPSTAQGYIGETLVVNPLTGDLTSAAKTILANPTFLEAEPGAAAAAGQRSALLETASAARMLPAFSAVLPWVAGATVVAIGTAVICDAVIGGCLEMFGIGDDPSKSGLTWTRYTTFPPEPLGTYGQVIPYGAYYTSSPVWFAEQWENFGCENGSPNVARPGSADQILKGNTGGFSSCTIGGKSKSVGPFVYEKAVRLGSSNRGIQAVPGGTPETVTFTPATDWSKRFADCLGTDATAGSLACGATNAERDALGQSIAHAIDPEGVRSPYETWVEIPDSCEVGNKIAPCLEDLEELELVPDVEELNWEEAVVEELDELDPQKTREEESERIIEIAPPLPAEVVIGDEVDIEANPGEEEMPQFVPEPGEGDDGQGEDEDEYKKRLAPIFIPDVGELSDGTLDPEVGPGRVARTTTQPGSGTVVDGDGHRRYDPSLEHNVRVWVNPPTAPIPPAGGGGSCNATIGAVDWSPLNQPLGDKFPFGIVTFFADWVSEWSVGGAAPAFDLTLFPAGLLGSDGIYWHIDMAVMEPLAEPVRIAFVFLAFVGLLWFLGTAAAKIQGDNS